MELHVSVLLVVAAIGQYLLELAKLPGNSGVLEVMGMAHVRVTDAITTEVLAVEVTTARQLLLLLDVHILYVLVEFIDAILGNARDVMDVHLMLMDII
jgi:hypothetical protein